MKKIASCSNSVLFLSASGVAMALIVTGTPTQPLRSFPTAVCAQTACNPQTAPPLQKDNPDPEVAKGAANWPDSQTKQVYIDPSLPSDMQTAMRNGIQTFAAETGFPVAALPAGAVQPDVDMPNTVFFLPDPDGATGGNYLATTGSNNNYITGTTINTSTYWNINSTDSSGAPDYDPTLPNASSFIAQVTEHELGHVFGLDNYPEDADIPPGTSIMQDAIGTNDIGGGLPSGVTQCDVSQMKEAEPKAVPPPDDDTSSDASGGGGGGGDASDGGDGGDGGGSAIDTISLANCYTLEDWDPETNTLSEYEQCYP